MGEIPGTAQFLSAFGFGGFVDEGARHGKNRVAHPCRALSGRSYGLAHEKLMGCGLFTRCYRASARRFAGLDSSSRGP